MKHIPKKSLGQNFLSSEGALTAMCKAGDINNKDLVLEIGPGKGALTKEILKKAGKVIAVEKDRELADLLREKFSQDIKNGKFELIGGDVLDFNTNTISKFKDFNYKIIANIPYNITGAILEKFLSDTVQPSCFIVLLQHEVAKRIVAKDKKESILSISIKAYGHPTYVQKVVRGSFYPTPNVDSAILAINNISRKNFKDSESENIFFSIVKAGFAHKRKKLIGNLKNYNDSITWEDVFQKISLDQNIRAEDLDLGTWISLADSVKDINNS